MPCKIYLRGDEDAIYSNDPADVIADRVESASDRRFVTVELTPYAHGEGTRTAYICPTDVVAILPMDPRELLHDLDQPPEWHPAA